MDQVRNGIKTAREDGKDMKSTAVGKDPALAPARRNSEAEANPCSARERLSPAGGDGKSDSEKKELKGCLMCGTCGSVGECVLD